MLRFLMFRLMQMATLLILVSFIGFAMLHLMPGGPLAEFAVSGELSAEDAATITAQYGLDQPLPIQYLHWAGRLLRGDWGSSYRDQQTVLSIVAQRVPATFVLMFFSTGLAVLFGAMVGTFSAMRPNSLVDHLATILSTVVMSLPTFWLAILAIYAFSVRLGWLPAGGMSSDDASLAERLRHFAAPCLVLTISGSALWCRYMRISMLEVLSQDFIRTAKSKGLSESSVVLSHALRNALIPIISLGGMQLPALLGGALVVETVFAWPGMGRLFYDSLTYHDYPVIMAIMMLSASLVLLGSLLADVLYVVVDPRISMS